MYIMTYLHLIFKKCLDETPQTITPAYAPPLFLKAAGGFALQYKKYPAKPTCYQLRGRQPFHSFELNLHFE
jgi:hypothetical protein